MTARKRVLFFNIASLAWSLSSWVTPAFGQFTSEQLREAREKYIREYLPCSDWTATVNRHQNTPVGQGWGGYSPTEWYIAADLTRAAGCGNGSGASRLRQALDFAERNTIENWWEIEIGVPRALAEGLLAGGASVSSEVRGRMENALRAFVSRQSLSEWNGANAAWRGWARFLAAIYLEDADLADSAVNLMATATSQGDYAHIQHDWTYFFHYNVLNMHYGGQHFGDYARYLKFTEGTPFSTGTRVNPQDPLRRTGLQVTLDWFKHFLRWIFYRGYGDPFTVSKFPQQQNSYGGRIQSGAELLASTAYPEVQPYRSMLQDIASHASNPIGARAFPTARYLVARRESFFSSLIMANLVEPHMEASPLAPIFGAVNIVDPATVDKLRRENIQNHPYQLLNAMTLPAAYERATVEPGSEYSGRENLSEIKAMLSNWGFFGVSTLGGYIGMGAQRLTGAANSFTAQRSWFFFDDEIVCVGSGIQASSSSLGGMRTLLYTFRADAGSFQSSAGSNAIPTAGGDDRDLGRLRWLQHNTMGYYFPETTPVRAHGVSSGFARVYMAHGNGASFAAILLPAHGATATQQYAAAPDVQVLQSDQSAHIVKDQSTNTIGIAAFTAVNTSTLVINFPGYVLYQNSGGQFRLSLYNPHREERLSSQPADDLVNPMVDFEISPEQATYRNYQLQVPFSLRKGAGSGMDLFAVNDLGADRSELQVNLRVYRKFEINGSVNNDGSVTIEKAWIALNDAAIAETQTPRPSNRVPVAMVDGAAAGREGATLTWSGVNSYDPDGGSITAYQWDFGDGATASGAQVSHRYAAAGNYPASLEVTDDEGAKGTANFEVRIAAQPDSTNDLRVLVSGDDGYEIYINGMRVGANSSWQTAEEYAAPLLGGKNVIAIKATNGDNAGGLVAEVHALNKFWPSNASWKIVLQEESNWHQVQFDDAQWQRATAQGRHGTAMPWAQFQNVTGISTDRGVEWIWSANNLRDQVIYLRFTLPVDDTQAPAAPTGVSIR
ncbi:MAG: PKD domain-containing protein [bacterium]